MRLVKCKYCGKDFNREEEEFVKVNNRYAHKKCYDEYLNKVNNAKLAIQAAREENKEECKLILDFAKEHFGSEADYPNIQMLIQKYITKNGFTISGIYKSLKYYYDVLNKPIDKANGSIGIVPYIYDEAKRYYYNVWLANQSNKDKEITEQIQEIHISNPERKETHKYSFFNFLDEEGK